MADVPPLLFSFLVRFRVISVTVSKTVFPEKGFRNDPETDPGSTQDNPDMISGQNRDEAQYLIEPKKRLRRGGTPTTVHDVSPVGHAHVGRKP